jgi:2-keto-4-pentenoate hydratase
MNTQIGELAARLRAAGQTYTPCEPLRQEIGIDNIDQAYAVQEINTVASLEAGCRLVGRKIGLTSKSVQKQLGVDQPDFGMLFAHMQVSDGEEISCSKLIQPKVEGEIAFILARDLIDEQLTMSDFVRSIGYAVAAIEVVDSRIKNWDIKIVDTIADNASSGLFVLGNAVRSVESMDFRLCGMVLERRGEQISLGVGAACLGNPLNAGLWLARKMVQLRRPLLAGDIIMSGALGPMVAVLPGDIIECSIANLGSVRANFVI